MGPHYLDRLFAPRSVAVIGASERPDAVGTRVFANLREGGYGGRLYAVNPNHTEVQGQPSHPVIGAIGQPVDLAVVATPAATVPEIVRQCGAQGVRAAVILSAGFGEADEGGRRLQAELREYAGRYGVRIVGPNCLGIMRPPVHLNATFSRNAALPGSLALVSQSGALCTAILDWALARDIGFSAMVSLGDAADVDFGDVLDFLALDPQTRSILLYVEGVQQARRFMSGLRAAARMKPVIVVKAGRHAEGSRAALSHTGALVGMDDAFDAAVKRAGAVRAMTIEQLFSAAEILSRGYRLAGNRLAIITNGGGPGVMAVDRAVDLGLAVPPLAPETLARLNAVLPPHWSGANPVDILGDATPARYREAVAACAADAGVDGLLAMLTPQAMTDPEQAALEVIAAAAATDKPVLACWMGERQVQAGWRQFTAHKLPHFPAPEAAVEAFAYLAAYYRNQQLLMQVPAPWSYRQPPDVDGARLIIEGALAERRPVLSSLEAKAVLTAFNIPVAQTAQAQSPAEALVAAESLGFPVAMKIDSPDISHKSDVGGVRLNIANAQAVRSAFNELLAQARRARPDARLRGVTLERMYDRAQGRELMIGVVRDPVFGPVISFGAGGTAVEVLRDRAVSLPPLNRFIIRDLIDRTRVARLLAAFRHLPPVDMAALEHALLRVSELVCELPHVQELDINPLIADEQGVAAVDVRIRVAGPPPAAERYRHMAIHPYPSHLASRWQLADGTEIALRPIRPEDAQIEQGFVHELSEESKYFRFMETLRELTPTMLVRLTQIDYDRELALIAVTERDGREIEIGVARYAINPDGESCEFALVVADRWHHRGIGTRLMAALLEAARARGLRLMEGSVLAHNAQMLAFVSHLGFSVRASEEDPGIRIVTKPL